MEKIYNKKKEKLNVGDVFALTLDDFFVNMIWDEDPNGIYPKFKNASVIDVCVFDKNSKYDFVSDYEDFDAFCCTPFLFRYLGNGKALELSSKKVFSIRYNVIYSDNHFTPKYMGNYVSMFYDARLDQYPECDIPYNSFDKNEDNVSKFFESYKTFFYFFKDTPLFLYVTNMYKADKNLMNVYNQMSNEERKDLIDKMEEYGKFKFNEILKFMKNQKSLYISKHYYNDYINEAYKQNELINYQNSLRKAK